MIGNYCGPLTPGPSPRSGERGEERKRKHVRENPSPLERVRGQGGRERGFPNPRNLSPLAPPRERGWGVRGNEAQPRKIT